MRSKANRATRLSGSRTDEEFSPTTNYVVKKLKIEEAIAKCAVKCQWTVDELEE